VGGTADGCAAHAIPPLSAVVIRAIGPGWGQRAWDPRPDH